MEWRKLKNIIILMLLALNLFFLVLVGEQSYASDRAQARMRAETTALLRTKNIDISEAVVPWGEHTQSIALSRERDLEQELQWAEKILNGVTTRQTGATTQYSGKLGTMQVYQSGQFALQLNPGAVPLEGEVERHAVDYLNTLGIPAQVKAVNRTEGAVTVELWQLWQEKPLFTCQITMAYQNDSLCHVQGLRLSGGTPLAGAVGKGLSPETLLVRLMGALREDSGDGANYDFQRILPGYLHRTSGVSAQRVTLIPVWRMETSRGEYLVLNCLTGILEDVYESDPR